MAGARTPVAHAPAADARAGTSGPTIAPASSTVPEPPAAGVQLGFNVLYAKPSGRMALVGARIVTMRHDAIDEVIADGVVIVDGNRIVAVGPRTGAGAPAVPADAQVIDVGGRYILPGLIDAHVHIASLASARRALESGVTTVRSAAGVPSSFASKLLSTAMFRKPPTTPDQS